MNFLYRFFWLVLAVGSACRLYAQPEELLISGTIRDRESNEPLPYASVSLKHHATGTIANEAGEFRISVSRSLERDTLVFSFVGYAKHLFPLSRFRSEKDLEVRLARQTTMLREVLVDGGALDANQIMEKAVQSISDNYPSSAFLMEGFFRETLQQDNEYVHLIEAAIKVYDKNFQRRLNHGITEEVSMTESRRSVNYAHPIVQGVRKQNSIMDLLDNNPVHYTRGLLNTKYFDYKVDSIIQAQDDIIYLIGTIPGRHRIFVSEKNFAILKTVEEIQEADTVKRPEFNLNDSLVVRRMVRFRAISEFQPYHGKMYLKYSNETDAFEIRNKKTGKREFLVESYKELAVTNLAVENVSPFSKGEKYDFKNDIVPKNYNPNFWRDNNIQLSPLSIPVKRDLEKEIPLSEQFSKVYR